MEVCSEDGAAASQGGGDAPPSCKHISWEEQVRDEEEQESTEAPRKELPPPLQQGIASTSTSSTTPSMDDNGFTPVQGQKSRDKMPRDPSMDPTSRRRPSKASQSPLPFPQWSEAERVANVHIIFESALNQTRPFSQWIYDCLETYFPHRPKKQLMYFSNVLCMAIAEFHLTSGCTPTGMCSPVLPQVVEAELPPMDALEVCLVKSKKVLKEASKMQSKLLTRVAKLKMAQEKSHPTEATHQEAMRVLCQTTEQLDQVRSTIAHHTADISRIEALLKDCKSTE